MSSSSCPPNYVFGVGRGVTGFTTRSDIGPDRSPTSIAVSGLSRGNRKGPEEDELDEFEVDYFELEAEAESHQGPNPNITEQFADLKRNLCNVSDEEWESIPEIRDYSKRNKKMKKRLESFVPVPNTPLEKAMKEQEHVLSEEPNSSNRFNCSWRRARNHVVDEA